jgi:hypothetical protein
MLRGLVIMLAVWSLAGDARADTNPTPISVPLLNANLLDPQVGAPYPSRITIAAPITGPNTSMFTSMIVLHAVTHPCPESSC